MKIGLRIDADTFRGTRDGLPTLYRILRQRSIRASFFFTVGPDNMGRHLRRLVRPKFAAKMLRTRAPRLYGWDILWRGTLVPGPIIGRRLADTLRQASREGHESGVHAWDHHAWQTTRLGSPAFATQLQQAVGIIVGKAQLTVVLIGVEQTVAIGVLAEQQPRRDTADQQQFVERLGRPILGRIGCR